ncbi:hypothetical protein BDQ17DRAFT_1250209 [Cyathus striatus]|nr:hypothetical protein BDQ17DRAFT_1250209 [Cyathus striatus]
MPFPHWYFTVILIAAYIPLVACTVDFRACLSSLRNGTFGDIGLDSHGHNITYANATAISYKNCLAKCGGAGQEPFAWSIFSPQFSAWLLPWLALVSQLPYGAHDKITNLESMVLTVGSPTLAAYSLSLTVLNGRWIARRFAASSRRYSNVANIVRVLTALQQFPLKVANDPALLASLIVLPQNDQWWEEMTDPDWIESTHSWSISAATLIAWVVITYVFTLIDHASISFVMDLVGSTNTLGQCVSSLWLWLLPIVIGWRHLSKYDTKKLKRTIKSANEKVYVADEHGSDPIHAIRLGTSERAIELFSSVDDDVRNDEQCTSPVYNYARFLPWVQSVGLVYDAYRAAAKRAFDHETVDPSVEWKDHKGSIHDGSRLGSRSHIVEYCRLDANEKPSGVWNEEAVRRIFIASLLALLVQWGTTGSAVVISYFTPTRGLSCRSGSYILYAILSTVVWMLLLVSSLLSFAHIQATKHGRSNSFRATTMGTLSIILRRAGKVIASINAVWIVVSCLFHFTNFFNRCFCNSGVLGLGNDGFAVIQATVEDIGWMKSAWIGGTVLAAGSVFTFIGFIQILSNPSLPE